jgi:hypothetical protein
MSRFRVHTLAIALVLAAAAAVPHGAAAQPATTVEGTIAKATATSAVVTTSTGTTTVTLNDSTRVIRTFPATFADVKVGTFMAITASKAADGALTAVSMSIIDSMPASRKGQWPMESGSIMTNMNVTSVVAGKSGHTLTLSSADQRTTIAVPDNTPVHRITVGKIGDLKAGQHVRVHGENDGYGVMTASFVVIE